MAVGVMVVVVLREQFGRLGLPVGATVVSMAVLVDDERCFPGADQAIAERLGQKLRSQDVVR